jgi:hypothetical protein
VFDGGTNPIDRRGMRSYDPCMPLWRCPHCATPQPEASRCWLCGRSTTTCAACRHYRRGVASGLGLCGKNPGRLALRGTEMQPCWEGRPVPDVPASVRDASGAAPRGREERSPRTFVPVDELRSRRERVAPVTPASPIAGGAGPARWSLWGDPDA